VIKIMSVDGKKEERIEKKKLKKAEKKAQKAPKDL